ncbi:MAG: hypothetical protein KC501_05575 [Myxococcales bacterium]|nr:hypothetical protein [Myxococcales bacterium]
MEVLERLHSDYGDAPAAPFPLRGWARTGGEGPHQAQLELKGNDYLRAEFPELDYVESARLVE